MNRRLLIVTLCSFVIIVGCKKNDDGKKSPKGGPASGWKIDAEETTIKFVGTKPKGKHDGGFKTVSGKINWAKKLNDSTIDVEIDTDSIWSDDDKLTNHLKSQDFFSVKDHPKINFEAIEITEDKGEGKTHNIKGNLTLLGKTKQISFPAEITADDDSVSVAAEFTINRHDFGMSYGKGKIDDDVKITVNVTAAK